MHFDSKQYLPALLLLAVVSAVWLTICRYGFINYDDGLHVYQNYYVLNASLANFAHLWQAPVEGLYIPLTYTIWMVLAKLSLLWPGADGGPLNPQLFHTANFFCHLGSSVLVYLIVARLVRNGWAALAGALLFALHPLQVEPVAWVTGLKDSLSGLMAVASIYCYLRYTEVSGQRFGRWLFYGLATLAFLLALVAKPGAAALPFMLAALALFVLGRTWRQVGLELIPWLFAIVPVFLMTAHSQAETPYRFVPLFWQRLVVAGDALSFYLYKLLWPLSLGPDYGRTPEVVLAHPWGYATAAFSFLGLGLLLWRYRRPWPVALFLVPALSLLPVLGLQTFSHQIISTVADRYLYLGMVGPALAVGLLLARTRSWIPRGVYGVLVFLWLILTVNQLRYWQDSFIFNEHALAVNPESWVAYNNMGEALAKEGRYAEAIPYFTKVGELYPEHYRSYWNKGMAMEYLGQAEEALALYQTAIRIEPNFAEGYNSIGALYLDRGEMEGAVANLRQALSLRPDMLELHGNLGTAYYFMQRYPEAQEEFLLLLAGNPTSFMAENGLANVLRAQGLDEEALWHYRQAVALNPQFAAAYNSLGELLLEKGTVGEAEREFRLALALAPDLPGLSLNLGRVLLAVNRTDEAIHFLQIALQQEPGQAEAQDLLRAALARKEAAPGP